MGQGQSFWTIPVFALLVPGAVHSGSAAIFSLALCAVAGVWLWDQITLVAMPEDPPA